MSGIVRANNAGQSGPVSNIETINSDDYVDASIDNAHLADDAAGTDEIAADAVTNAKLANMATSTVKANATSGSANPTDVVMADGDFLIANASGLVTVPITGDVVINNAGAATIQANSVDVAMIEDIARGSIIVGNASAATAELTKGGAATVLTSNGTDIAWAAAAGGLDSALTSFVSDGDYRSIYMLGAWPQNGNPADNDIRGYGGQFKADINGTGSVISQSSNGGAWLFTSGNSDLRSCGLFAGDAILQASDDFTITCRFNKTSASLFSFGMAADVQGYRPEAQNDSIASYFGAGDEVTCTTDNAGTETSTDIAAGSVSGENYATIIVSGNGTSVAFWLNGVLGTTHTANIPSATDLYLFLQVSSYGSAYRTCHVMDFFAYREV